MFAKTRQPALKLRMAKRASGEKSRLLPTLAHEIRSQLSAVTGIHRLLLETPLTAQQNTLVRAATDMGEKLLCLVNEILDFSKLQSGRVELEQADFDLIEELEMIVTLLGVTANAKGIELTYRIDGDIARPLRGDLARLRQLLFNLVGNAIKFTDRGSVSITLSQFVPENAKQGTVWIYAQIADTGTGIAVDKIPRLFQDFTQADLSTTRRYGGSGLGLAICRRIVELMGGEIGVDSAPGAGSRFWFKVPLQADAAPLQVDSSRLNPRTRIDRANDTPRALNILVGEDHPGHQLLLRTLLEKAGHRVMLVGNGRQALAAVRKNPRFDLILLDVWMPEMDGLAACRAIRNLPPAVARVPILAMSADPGPEARQRALDAGMNDFIGKPVDVRQLLEALNTVRAALAG